MEEALELAGAKDTKERMAGVERLHHLLEASRKPLTCSEVTSLVHTCLDLLKDNSNFRVSQGGLRALASAAVVAGDNLKIHFNALVPAAVERLGDAKQPVRDAARRLLLTLMEVSSPTIIVERAGSYAWEHKSWRVREGFACTVTSAINLFASTDLCLQRVILPPILHMLNDPNQSVREAAISCIEEKNKKRGFCVGYVGYHESAGNGVSCLLASGTGNIALRICQKAAYLAEQNNGNRRTDESEMYTQIGSQFQEELQRHQLPSYMVKDINARLERIEPKLRSSDGAAHISSASEHRFTNPVPKRGSPKAKNLSRETSPFGGSSPSRSQSYNSALPNFAGDEMEDGIVSEFGRSSPGKKANGTPVKMLMAQEMLQDLDSRQTSPNVVARLMGLDALPQQHSDSGVQSHSQCYSRNSHSDKPIGHWQEEHGFSNKHVDHEVHRQLEQSEYKDIFEIWQQSLRKNCRIDKSPQKGRGSESIGEKNLALIRQKFMEAKRLATDEKLRQTKEFQDALDVLSSNGELFLKVLQEPNSLISRHHYAESISPPTETKRITVLRPSKMMVDDKFAAPAKRNEKQTKKQPLVNHVWDSHNGFSPTMSAWKANDKPTQPTRIVVLKPSLAMVNNAKGVVSSTPSSPSIPLRENFFEEAEDEEAQEAREVAKEITLRMRENLAAGHRRDETLLSSVLSNGYIGDESSFDKSETEFAAGNLSDSEVMSPTSRHSWDYVNRYGSPCSSSFSRASYSPESSVCREAKKRLSERWAMMASNGSNVEQRHIRRSSSTLGEMLALSDIKKSEICEEATDKDQDPRASTSCLNSSMGARESGGDSPRSLPRSKSVPVSSAVYGGRLNVEVSDPILCKGDGPMEAMKKKASKSSFAGKVTSLFFSRNKKIRNEQCSKPQSLDEFQLAIAESPGNSVFAGRTRECSEVCLSPTSRLHSGSINGDLNDGRLGQGIFSQQGGLYVSQPSVPGIQGENQDQPSPISVLELPFEEERATLDCSRRIEPNPYGGKQVSSCLNRANLIDKSPPIGSVARTLSWDECSVETASSYPLNSPFICPRVEDNEAELRFLVQSLIKMAGLGNKGQMSPNFARWHSPESPLDPLLREKYIDLTAKEPLPEAKQRQLRSTRKLVFDCVNAALIDIAAVGTTASQWAGPHGGAHFGVLEGELGALADKVWGWMKEERLSGQVKLLSAVDEESGESGDSNSLVESFVRKEVVGKGWAEQMRLEVDKIGKEIAGKLIQEIVEDSVVELTGRG